MAPPTDKATRPLGLKDSSNSDLTIQLNNVITQLRVLCTKLDADVGVTDTNYAALITDVAVAAAPRKLSTPGF